MGYGKIMGLCRRNPGLIFGRGSQFFLLYTGGILAESFFEPLYRRKSYKGPENFFEENFHNI